MPRNMSFSHNVEQIRDRSKTVTRRLGWRTLKPGDRVWAVKKAMGLKPGEKVERLALLEIVSVRRESLSKVTKKEVAREGFSGRCPEWFILLFYKINPTMEAFDDITRIEFKYVCDCCERGDEYNGFSSAPLSFTCPKGCTCHD